MHNLNKQNKVMNLNRFSSLMWMWWQCNKCTVLPQCFTWNLINYKLYNYYSMKIKIESNTLPNGCGAINLSNAFYSFVPNTVHLVDANAFPLNVCVLQNWKFVFSLFAQFRDQKFWLLLLVFIFNISSNNKIYTPWYENW